MRGQQSTPTSFFEGLVIDGRYQLMDEIGRGSIGRVYRAEQLRVNRQVAIKILRRNILVDERMALRFEREAQAVAKLDHPNCLTLFDFGYDEEIESLYMATELFGGGSTLRDHLTTLSEKARLQVGFYIADALMHAHAAGVVHRDLKPENVLISFDIDGRVEVKVVDFGLARVFERGDTSGERRLTMAGEIYGSPRYLSPEQCRGKLDIDTSSDMYSFGVMLYELFEGCTPFDDATVPMILTAHVSDEPPQMTALPVADIEQLICELLSKERAQRPSAHEARDVFARNVDLSVSGIFDQPGYGLNEATLGSDAFDDVPPTEPFDPAEPAATEPAPFRPPPAPRGLGEVLATREARIGMAVGACLTVVLSIFVAMGWLMVSG